MSVYYICEFCCKREFDDKWKLNGHKARCLRRKEIIAANAFNVTFANNVANEIFQEDNINATHFPTEYNEDLVENINPLWNDTEISDPSFIAAYRTATNAYLDRQKDLFNIEELQELEAGFTKNINGLRTKANIRIYLEICEFVSNCHGLSISECDALLELIRRVSFINGSEIPIPAKYYSIHDRIFQALHDKSIKIVKTHYQHCESLYGKNNNLGKIPAVVTNILEIITCMFIDPEIYPFLHLDYEESKVYKTEIIGNKRQRTVDVVYGEFYNSEFFKRSESEIREQWGPCKIVPVFFGIDATNLNQSGSINATPVYLSLGNMDIDMLRSHVGIELCGYMPVSLASKAKQRCALEANGIKHETNWDDCIKIHSRWLEQEFLNDICAPIRWYSTICF